MFTPFSMLLLFLQLLFSLGGVYVTLLLAWHALELYSITKNGEVHDLDLLQTPRTDGKLDGTAVICGGSIAGLLAARACQKHFRRVIIVEPETWLATDAGRRVDGWKQDRARTRVMQYRSLQGNQGVILKYLTKMFPDFQDECQRSGIQSYNSVGPADFGTSFAGTLVKMPWKYYTKETMPRTIFSSRKGLETIIRYESRLIAGLVVGVTPDAKDPSRMGQVSVRTESGTIVHIDASLVVDCTGITRAGLKWLVRAGYGQSTLFARLPLPEHRRKGAICTYLEDQPSLGRRFFVLTNMDGDQNAARSGGLLRLLVVLVPFRDPVPPWVFDTIEMLKEVETRECVSQVHVPPTGYIQYHLADHLPSNFAALGDSVMSVNPTFGVKSSSGLTKDFSTKFFKKHYQKTNPVWQLAKLMGNQLSTHVKIENTRLRHPVHGALARREAVLWSLDPLRASSTHPAKGARPQDDHAALALFRGSHDLGTQ
ncbi:hypothetical protein BDZ89DRAFT_1035621 [Hymenopellis radicata]|nr:hypothetical protein BDZ89DRAFT_1035621 [Hymenopellis radicata]